jgi:dGTPase
MDIVDFHAYETGDVERIIPEEERSTADKRGPFERDRARIIHSAAFRRLQGKTQVYGLGASDYYRTRLTHSLEVAQIGKALALNLGADASLVEAICVAHDIGHPPFGHAGEDELYAETIAAEGFNANAQNIRILTDTERKSTQYDGLNLTKATLDGLLKYPWELDPAKDIRKGYYKSDAPIVEDFHVIGEKKTFECQIMDWADDVAYSSHDLEDALAIGMVSTEELQDVGKRTEILAVATNAYATNYPDYERERLLKESDVSEALDRIIEECISCPGDRLKNIKAFVGNHINDCVTTATARSRSSTLRRYRFQLVPNPEMVQRVEIYKAITVVCVIKTNEVLTLQQAGRRVVRDLYKAYTDAKNPELRYFYASDWTPQVNQALSEEKTGNVLALQRLARDYVATMTDHFAEEQWRKLYLPGEGTLFGART